MSEPDYDDPYIQRGWGGNAPETRKWDEAWRALFDVQKPWARRSSGRAEFVQCMRRLSSLLEQDKRFWSLSAKHAIVDLMRYIKEDGLLHLKEDKDFRVAYPNTQLSITYSGGLDWNFFSRLVLHSLLSPLAALDNVAPEDLRRFDELRRQADEVGGIVTYAHFINRLREVIWDDDLIEQVTAKSFVDVMIAVAENRAQEISPPDPEPDWRPIEGIIRSAIQAGNASVSPPSEFD